MKKSIVLNKKSGFAVVSEAWFSFWFRFYAFIHTLLFNPRLINKAYWSVADCYIRLGKDGYISKNKLYDLNGDITPLAEISINSIETIHISLSEPELMKIKKLAEEKHISVKELLMLGIERLQITN
jgi:hypothetical protein